MPPRKRPDVPLSNSAVAAKRQRTGIAIGASRKRAGPIVVKEDPDGAAPRAAALDPERLKDEFVRLFSEPGFRGGGVSNGALKQRFGERYVQLVPIINDLTKQSRLTMSKVGEELFYNLVSNEEASKFSGLDTSARMVYQVIQKAGNMGIWSKDIRTQTNIPQQSLNKMLKTLENRQLIKWVKSVTAKQKKLYMLYNLTPAKEITGGPWYTELEFDHEFISELRKFILMCVQRMNGGRGVTLAEVGEKMKQANVSRVQLNLEEVQQLMQTLAFDYMIEQTGVNDNGEALFVEARKVTSMCEFKWWEVLSPDFHFRDIKFEDGITLGAHEPHHHTA